MTKLLCRKITAYHSYRGAIIALLGVGLFLGIACSASPTPTPTSTPTPRYSEGEIIGLVQAFLATASIQNLGYSFNCLARIQGDYVFNAMQEDDGNWKVELTRDDYPDRIYYGPWRVYEDSRIVQSLGDSC